MKQFKTQTGNALFLILIAIALLGLLTVTMTRSSSTSNDTGNYEQNQIAASEILNYAKSIENAVQSLLARGCSENDLSFWHDSDSNGTEDGSDTYYNAGSPTDHSCHVFEPEGSGMAYIAPNENWLDTSKSGLTAYQEIFISKSHCINDVGTGSGSCSDRNIELILFIFYNKKSICLELNRLSGVNNPSGNPPNEDQSSARFDGAYTSTASSLISTSELDGKMTACFMDTTGVSINTYAFYHVLHAR